jgi:hypothetical protein
LNSSSENSSKSILINLLSQFLFILLAGILVLKFEYLAGNFVFYFYKPKLYYSSFNKIIFPIYFWAGSFAFFYFFRRLNPHSSSFLEFQSFFPRIILFHLYLLILSHSLEITPDFALIPPHLKSIEFGSIYEQWIMHAIFLAYNTFSIRVLFRFFTDGCKSLELIHPLSLSIPFIFLINPTIHLLYICLGIFLYLFWEAYRKSVLISRVTGFAKWDYSPLLAIFFLSLILRVWYANYLVSFGEFGLGFGADGPVYFKSALAFSSGNIEEVNFWHSPFYAFYLSLFLSLFGEGAETVFYGQAVVGSLVPVIVFLIGRHLFGNRAALWAGFLTATSHLCIHYSVVINRSTPMTLTVALLTYLCLKSKNKKNSSIVFVGFGFIGGATFYFGQESIFAFFALLLILFWNRTNNFLSSGTFFKGSYLMTTGVLLATLPMNIIFFQHNDHFIPLGRDKPNTNISTSTFTYSGNPYALRLVKMGFDPIAKTKKSFEVFIERPSKVTQLLLGKLFSEIPGFLLDPGGIFLTPLHLSVESFYGAHLQFYIYLLSFFGFLLFLVDKKFNNTDKYLILGQITLYCIFSSLIIMGTFRFRAPIAPISMVLLGFCLSKISFKNQEAPLFKAELLNFTKKIPLLISKSSLLTLTTLIFLLLITWTKIHSKPAMHKSNYTLSQWTDIGNQQLRSTQTIKLNTTVFAFYEKVSNPTKSELQIVFNICRFLMPGEKPFYRLALDGQFIGPPKAIPSGCSKIQEPFEVKYDVGILNLYVYFTTDGEINETRLQKYNLDGGGEKESLSIPIIKFNLDKKEIAYKNLFENYSWDFLKIDKPLIQARK